MKDTGESVATSFEALGVEAVPSTTIEKNVLRGFDIAYKIKNLNERIKGLERKRLTVLQTSASQTNTEGIISSIEPSGHSSVVSTPSATEPLHSLEIEISRLKNNVEEWKKQRGKIVHSTTPAGDTFEPTEAMLCDSPLSLFDFVEPLQSDSLPESESQVSTNDFSSIDFSTHLPFKQIYREEVEQTEDLDAPHRRNRLYPPSRVSQRDLREGNSIKRKCVRSSPSKSIDPSVLREEKRIRSDLTDSEASHDDLEDSSNVSSPPLTSLLETPWLSSTCSLSTAVSLPPTHGPTSLSSSRVGMDDTNEALYAERIAHWHEKTYSLPSQRPSAILSHPEISPGVETLSFNSFAMKRETLLSPLLQTSEWMPSSTSRRSPHAERDTRASPPSLGEMAPEMPPCPANLSSYGDTESPVASHTPTVSTSSPTYFSQVSLQPQASQPLYSPSAISVDGLRVPIWLWEALFPHQKIGIQWLWKLHKERVGGLLGDEMGLGKTIQIVAFVAALHYSKILQRNWEECEPASIFRNEWISLKTTASASKQSGFLIVCPATVVHQWQQEFHRWFPPLRVCVYHQKNPEAMMQALESAHASTGILITTYETMRTQMSHLLTYSWKYIILDEGQKIRNPDAAITLAVKKFHTPHRILLSGSPIQNNLKELWSLFDFIYPGLLGTLPVFEEQFADPIRFGGYGGASRQIIDAAYHCAILLRKITQPHLLRRSKEEVEDILKLPAKSEQVLFCHLTPLQYYVYVDFLKSQNISKLFRYRAKIFSALTIMRKICNHPDLLFLNTPKEDWPQDFGNVERSGKMKVLQGILKIWKSENHRALIFCQTLQTLNIIEQYVLSMNFKYIRMDGLTPIRHRQRYISTFNKDSSIFLMLLTTRVGGVGINLTGANRVIIFDPDWNPMTDTQVKCGTKKARERCWRIGQHQEVLIYRFISTHTIEEKIYQRQIFKNYLSQKILKDPRQKKVFQWNELQEFFEFPTAPPDLQSTDSSIFPKGYEFLLRKAFRFTRLSSSSHQENISSTKKISHKNKNLSTDFQNEQNKILQTLFDSKGIQTIVQHDPLESEFLDEKLVSRESETIAKEALRILKISQKERQCHNIEVPTWTGKEGMAGAPLSTFRSSSSSTKIHPQLSSSWPTGASQSHTEDTLFPIKSSVLIERLKKIHVQDEIDIHPGDRSNSEFSSSFSQRASPSPLRTGYKSQASTTELRMAEKIIRYFYTKKSQGYTATTGEILEHFAPDIPEYHKSTFKALLKQISVFTRQKRASSANFWKLRPEFVNMDE